MRLTTSIILIATCLVSPGVWADTSPDETPVDWDVEEIEVLGESQSLFLKTAAKAPGPKAVFRENPDTVFSSLSDGEWVDIEYETQGCFHSFRRDLRILGGPKPRLEVSTPGWFPTDDVSGEIALSQDDLVQLDTLISFYQSERGEGCTTSEEVTFRWKRAGIIPRTTRVEKFHDSSCGPHDGYELLTIWKMLRRLP